jgi:hypothetical protein
MMQKGNLNEGHRERSPTEGNERINAVMVDMPSITGAQPRAYVSKVLNSEHFVRTRLKQAQNCMGHTRVWRF